MTSISAAGYIPTAATAGKPTATANGASAANSSDLGAAPAVKKPSAADEFLAYQHKSWAQKMREQILKSLGYTEEDLQKMEPEKRQAVEKQIAQIMEEKMKEEARKQGIAVDLVA